MFKHLISVLCIALAMYGSTAQAQDVGQPAKLTSLTMFDGSKFDPETTKGKVTLLYFWASWCPICRQEIPVIEKHYQTYKDKGFVVLGVNFRDKEEKARELLTQVGPVTYPNGKISDDYRSDYPKLHGTPTWYLIDRKGIIRKVVIGQTTITGGWLDGLKKELEAALAEHANR